MNFYTQKRLSMYFIIVAIISVITLILWNTFVFFERFKQVERDKIEIWAQSQKAFISNNENDYLELNLLINTTNNKIPIINISEDGNINLHANIPKSILDDQEKFNAYLIGLKKENKPINIELPNGQKQFLFYGSSIVLKNLKYYPLAITLVILLLIGVLYFFFLNSKVSEQNRLWAGMAKETAHQIGTPLSSLVGWIEILEMENISPDYLVEMKKDIDRLEMITDRFSKIGSVPQLEPVSIKQNIKENFDYLTARSSHLIDFSLELPDEDTEVLMNPILFSWTFENLVKNAIDAMKGKGGIHVELLDKNTFVQLLISDTGIGIPKTKFRTIFEPGVTSKARGWGLGLSLAKRIINDYHNGNISVKESEIGKGTTFQITLKKSV